MSSWAAEFRRQEAARRRAERASRQRQKELERLVKQRVKLSELEQARLEVETHENALDDLLSVHREHVERIDWVAHASALPPPPPVPARRHEFAARLAQAVAPRPPTAGDPAPTLEEACLLDEAEHRAAQQHHQARFAEWQRLQTLAKRVLAAEPQAYSDAVTEFAPLTDLPTLGPTLRLTVHDPKRIGCTVTIKGREIVPAETRTLTAAGKLSVKPMPKARFHEIYQDHVCGCALRIAREMLALLPVDTVVVTASIDAPNTRTGHRAAVPVLSVAFDRATAARLDFERLDPSDAMGNFPHRGDAKASRRSGEFEPVTPLAPEETATAQPARPPLERLLADLRQLRADTAARLKPTLAVDAPEETPSPA